MIIIITTTIPPITPPTIPPALLPPLALSLLPDDIGDGADDVIDIVDDGNVVAVRGAAGDDVDITTITVDDEEEVSAVSLLLLVTMMMYLKVVNQ